ncbi:1-phosphofructokinase family hexose kinase [Pararoseomonas indoligenes]|uniref:Phosphofructokinase n=1 Tax=Roseomonas indoligenes TaxID=2820811 RepID=A0A940S8B8_9PROT|nr:1-phosphofructokinase family hexose kinase [Pararoseomonas indoligenes]MBP0493947.1 1-phosphofructokinase family hexose kinase [Pararoseomonas indoligenes]
MPGLITTLTPNPTIDLACEAEKVRPIHKIRTTEERHDPGGGGVNVARVVQELGGRALAVVLSGGVTGRFLEELLEEGGVPHRGVPVSGLTRISQTVMERSSGQEYRFVPEGPEVTEAEWKAALATMEEVEADWMVGSGSLPRGVPEDFHARLAALAGKRGLPFVLDTSGAALRAAVEAGGIALAKPSLGEFEALVGRKLENEGDQQRAAVELVRSGKVGILAVTLGRDGAMLATEEGALRLPALPVEVKGAVGAGDSFLAAMTMALSDGRPAAEAFAWGVAAGAAAVSSAGTAHPRRADVEALRRRIPDEALRELAA